jgi:hypothetical protein
MERRGNDKQLRVALDDLSRRLADLRRETGLTEEELVRELVPRRAPRQRQESGERTEVDWTEHNRKIEESRKRRAAQASIFLDLVRRNLPTKLVYRPGVMSEEEATQHMHGFATRFYASHLARVAKEGLLAGKEIEEEISGFDEMYYLLELASLATMIAVEAYDWDNFPELEGMLGASAEDEEVFYRADKEVYSREEVMRALAKAREKVREVERYAELGEDLSGRVPGAKAAERAEAMREVLASFREALGENL